MDDGVDSVFRALADPTRRAVLDLLRARPRTTGDLARAFPGLSRFAVMKHLGVLAEAGLVVTRREGRRRWNHLNAVPLRRVYERWVSRYESAWAAGLLGLKRLIEAEAGGRGNGDVAMAEPSETGRVLRVEQEVRIKGSPERVFEALTTGIGEWWPHRFRADARVVLEPRVGGRFFEDWGDGRGALFAEVTFVDPPVKLCTRGPMGMRGAASTVKWYTLERDGSGTIVKVSLHAWGDISDEVAASYTAGTRSILVEALKPYIEEGRRYLPPPP